MDLVSGAHHSPFISSEWWRSAIIYQIYPRSFADGNGEAWATYPESPRDSAR